VREDVIDVLWMVLTHLAYVKRRYTATDTLSNTFLAVSDEQTGELLDNGLVSVMKIAIGGQRE